MIDKPLYAPCQKDIEWANGMLDALLDGGVLTFPASQLTYHVDHEHRR